MHYRTNNHWTKWTALVCCGLYLLLYLVLPLMAFILPGGGISGSEWLSATFWAFLPLIATIAMVISILAVPGQVAGIVCSCGAVMPLISYFVIRGMIKDEGGFTHYFGGAIGLTMGSGAILPVFLGAAAAVFCFINSNINNSTSRPGPTPDPGSDPDPW